MFERVYLGPTARREHGKVEIVVRTLFDHYCRRPERCPSRLSPCDPIEQRVTDYIAGMTDRYCIAAFEELTVPRAFGGAVLSPAGED